jgi:SAM-dependent methyltransferase
MQNQSSHDGPPTASSDFDRAYRAPFTFWGDIRMPREVAELTRDRPARRILELGCGLGRFSRNLARAGHHVVGVDFSPVAIQKARARAAGDVKRPEFVVGDVTDLSNVDGSFDLSFDVGCYHCLNAEQQSRYAAEVSRLLAPGGTHLIWVMDDSPSGLPLAASDIQKVFVPRFVLRQEAFSRRRLVRSHWYWLERQL